MNFLEFAKEVLKEDIGRGDLFERVAKPTRSTAKILAKSDGVFAGRPYVEAIGKLLELEFSWKIEDGKKFKKGDILATLQGDSTSLLKGERSILNTILHASSIATNANRFVEIAQGKITILDTRKTRPKLREFEKYATRVGGVVNHRMGLDDCLMLKDTHLKTLNQTLKEFIQQARKKIPFSSKIEVECESLHMAKEAFEAGADIVMCDNMELEEIKKVVEIRNRSYPHILLEASGNITLENLKEYIQTGIDAISSGSIIHQAVWLDISMKVEL